MRKKTIVSSIAGVAAVTTLLGVLLFATIAARGGGPEPDHTGDTGIDYEAGTVRQSPDTHPYPDAETIAAERGITVTKAKEAPDSPPRQKKDLVGARHEGG